VAETNYKPASPQLRAILPRPLPRLDSGILAMTRRLLGCFALWMLATTAGAQDPFAESIPRRIPARPSQATVSESPELPAISPEAMTPQLYLYLQDQKRHDDPSQAVRRKAEFKASQRMSRMASMKWFGMSNARPQVAAVPMMGVYSPAWIGNGYDRYDWVGGTYPSASVYIESETIQR
jgi:hypothetical protein